MARIQHLGGNSLSFLQSLFMKHISFSVFIYYFQASVWSGLFCAFNSVCGFGRIGARGIRVKSLLNVCILCLTTFKDPVFTPSTLIF